MDEGPVRMVERARSTAGQTFRDARAIGSSEQPHGHGDAMGVKEVCRTEYEPCDTPLHCYTLGRTRNATVRDECVTPPA
jgi:hypothetical protein